MRLWPLSLSNTQFPPTFEPFSKQTAGISSSRSALSTVSPEDPAPMTAVVGSTPETLPQMRLENTRDGMLTLHAPGADRRRLRQYACVRTGWLERGARPRGAGDRRSSKRLRCAAPTASRRLGSGDHRHQHAEHQRLGAYL